MFTEYWSVDAFFISNLLLWVIVIAFFGYQHITGGGILNDQSNNDDSRG